jgi:branched-chain amino acid transport system ATP-binding protein
MSLVMEISDAVVVLHEGSILAQGKPAEIQKDSEVIRIYLGEDHA